MQSELLQYPEQKVLACLFAEQGELSTMEVTARTGVRADQVIRQVKWLAKVGFASYFFNAKLQAFAISITPKGVKYCQSGGIYRIAGQVPPKEVKA